MPKSYFTAWFCYHCQINEWNLSLILEKISLYIEYRSFCINTNMVSKKLINSQPYPTVWLRMHIWRMSLRRMKSTIISYICFMENWTKISFITKCNHFIRFSVELCLNVVYIYSFIINIILCLHRKLNVSTNIKQKHKYKLENNLNSTYLYSTLYPKLNLFITYL